MKKELIKESEVLASIGRNIRQARKGCRFTQQQLAELCGFGKASLSRIESGSVNLQILTLNKLAMA